MSHAGDRHPIRVALLFVASLGLSLTLAELALRWLEPEPRPQVAGPGHPGLPVLRTVKDLVVPNVRGVYKGTPYRTNRLGFRGPDVEASKPAGALRVAVLGDSITMGEGVAEEEAYPALLQARLDAPDRRLEVLNLGLSGLNLRGSLRLRLPIALRLDPDLLVYGFTINDLEGLPGYRKACRPPSPDSVWHRLRLLRRLHGAQVRFGSSCSYRTEITENFLDNPSVWAEFEKDLEQLAAVGRRRGLCVAVLLHTQLWSDRGWTEAVFDRVERAARGEGLHVVPSASYFEGADVAALTLGPRDPHPNAEGHRRLASALTSGLAALPEACWRGARPDFASSDVTSRR